MVERLLGTVIHGSSLLTTAMLVVVAAMIPSDEKNPERKKRRRFHCVSRLQSTITPTQLAEGILNRGQQAKRPYKNHPINTLPDLREQERIPQQRKRVR
ncbi:hypothetical protein CDAR_291251 [Caerostris darwini]|uniref:Secreted protein n=1 Tax=Caerostris darwini TaxID=1538125 RepID=A0AAV4RIK1_9ARAC|nr:hypothetical protein CDAR_291251 [Caerostris darwini]